MKRTWDEAENEHKQNKAKIKEKKKTTTRMKIMWREFFDQEILEYRRKMFIAFVLCVCRKPALNQTDVLVRSNIY